MVRNSLEAMPAGGTVLIRTYCEKDKVVLAVQDQGEGIGISGLCSRKLHTFFRRSLKVPAIL